MIEIDIYNLASLVYDGLHRTCRPGQTIVGLDRPWESRTEKTQLAWEEAVRRALVRAGSVPGDPSPESLRFSRQRQFRQEKPPEGETT
jgi:hypothetical protein